MEGSFEHIEVAHQHCCMIMNIIAGEACYVIDDRVHVLKSAHVAFKTLEHREILLTTGVGSGGKLVQLSAHCSGAANQEERRVSGDTKATVNLSWLRRFR